MTSLNSREPAGRTSLKPPQIMIGPRALGGILESGRADTCRSLSLLLSRSRSFIRSPGIACARVYSVSERCGSREKFGIPGEGEEEEV